MYRTKIWNITMKQPTKVVTLPTENKNPVTVPFLVTPKGSIYKHVAGGEFRRRIKEGFIPQHLYITVSQDVEPIKEGDWYRVMNDKYNKGKRSISQADEKSLKLIQDSNYICHKIIATTDPKLETSSTGYTEDRARTFYEKLPQLQQSFLKEFVANPDREFEVEYEEGTCKCLTCNKTIASTCEYTYKCNIQIIKKLKLNQDNTVNITPVSIKQDLLHICKWYQGRDTDALKRVENWVKENL
jgi:hypothetical protein